MAGRNNYLPPNALRLGEMPLPRAPHPHAALIDDPRVLHRVPIPPGQSQSLPSRTHPAFIEERITFQHRDIQTLLHDNQRLAATHVALKHDFAAVQHELRHLSSRAASIKAESDAQVHEVYERSLKMEAEVRSIDGLNAKLDQVREDVQKLSVERKELNEKLRAINGDLARVYPELQQLPAIAAEIETMHKEIQKGRAAIEYEKKMQASNLEQSQAMEKNMISMAREIEKLRAELANYEKRAYVVATSNPGYAAVYGTPEIGYGGNSYPDPYAIHQVQGGADVATQYGPGTVPHAHYDMQHAHNIHN